MLPLDESRWNFESWKAALVALPIYWRGRSQLVPSLFVVPQDSRVVQPVLTLRQCYLAIVESALPPEQTCRVLSRGLASTGRTGVPPVHAVAPARSSH